MPKSLTRTDLRQFGGMASAYDPHDLTGGMVQHQENLVTTVPGELAGRRGFALQLWSQGVTTAGSPVISAYCFQHPVSSGGYVVYHTTSGTLRAALILLMLAFSLWHMPTNALGGEDVLFAPPGLEASVERHHVDANFTGPAMQGVCSAVHGDESRLAGVAGLNVHSGPTAIAGTVRPVVVNAVNGVVRARPWAHVLVEVLERLQPAVAHVNATTAVVAIGCVGFIKAPLFHAGPDSPLAGPREAVSSVPLGCLSGPIAAAANLATGGQLCPLDHDTLAAVAETLPKVDLARFGASCRGYEHPKPLPGEVDPASRENATAAPLLATAKNRSAGHDLLAAVALAPPEKAPLTSGRSCLFDNDQKRKPLTNQFRWLHLLAPLSAALVVHI